MFEEHDAPGFHVPSGTYDQQLMHARPQPGAHWQHQEYVDSFDYRLHIRSAPGSELGMHGFGRGSALSQGLTQGWDDGTQAAPRSSAQFMSLLNAGSLPMRSQGPERVHTLFATPSMPYNWSLDE